VPYWVSRSPEAFEDLLSRTGVTVLNQTPSAFRQLVEADRVAPKPLALRLVIFGGEALQPELLRPWLDVHGEEHPRLVNMYGITETTVHVTYHPVTRRDLEQPWASVIGRPIPDLTLYVLDPASNLCPIGVPGELFVGGSGVARGYWNRPDLTAARFLEDPFSHEPGSRLYRTGDRVRYRPDGELEYLGRLDHQVKIRGFRIELGEIETELARCPGVEEVVVVPSTGTDGKRLIACLRFDAVSDSVLLSPRELRGRLSLRLPDPMIPSAFVWFPEFPRLPNGKIDRLALASVDRTGSTPAEQYVAPRTPVEETLARVFGELLDSEPVGVEDNFFERGGHSLLAVRLASRVRDAFGVEIPLETIFQRPTISGLAAAVAGKQAERMDSGELASLLAELEARPPRREA
jgi:acyl-CoA synthetase (AMP-forming)/AMP-acid ligase II/acyl carrier protein